MKITNGLKGAIAALFIGLVWLPSGSFGEGAGAIANGYAVEPGDFLRVSVWKEEDLQQELLVRPDGGISFPLAGDILAAGRTVTEIKDVLVERIKDYIPEPEVTVQVLQIQGNTVYVMGKVNRPGAFVMTKQLDVTQASALAGGLATFADAAISRSCAVRAVRSKPYRSTTKTWSTVATSTRTSCCIPTTWLLCPERAATLVRQREQIQLTPMCRAERRWLHMIAFGLLATLFLGTISLY